MPRYAAIVLRAGLGLSGLLIMVASVLPTRAQPIDNTARSVRPFRVIDRAVKNAAALLAANARPILQAELDGVEGLESGQPILKLKMSNVGTLALPATSIIVESGTLAWTPVTANVPEIPARGSQPMTVAIPVTLSPGEYLFRVSTWEGIDRVVFDTLLTAAFTVPKRVDLAVETPSLRPGVVGKRGRLRIPVRNRGTEPVTGATLRVAAGAYWNDTTLAVPDLPAGDRATVSLPLRRAITGTRVEYAAEVLPPPGAREIQPADNVVTGVLTAQTPVPPPDEPPVSTDEPFPWIWIVLICAVAATATFFEPARSRIMRVLKPNPAVHFQPDAGPIEVTQSKGDLNPWEIELSIEPDAGRGSIARAVPANAWEES